MSHLRLHTEFSVVDAPTGSTIISAAATASRRWASPT
jgi:hypothetical protein